MKYRIPLSISNMRLIYGVPPSKLTGLATFVTHYDSYTLMDHILSSPLADLTR
jgi:hypothetical protein